MLPHPRILIVDDSLEDCATYERYLAKYSEEHFTCLIANSAAQALTLCRTELPDCVLLDFNLPGTNGLDFLQQLRHEHGENTPAVVMLTGVGNESIAVQAMKLGAQDYLVKGMNPEALRHSIHNALECVSLRRQVDSQQQEVVRLLAAQSHLVKELELRAADLADADRSKNEFLAILAHELRNPLGPIRNAAQIIRLDENASLSSPVQLARDVIDRQVGHMARLIDDLLDVSRIVRGKVLLRKEPVELARLIAATIDDHRGEFNEAGLQLKLDLRAGETWVDGDPTRLSQVLSNILDNARKFTPREGTITVSLHLTENNQTAVLKVSDTGEGLDANTLTHMFDVFSQADRSLDRSRGGLGLGLAIVKGLAQLHDGDVLATSAGPGLGCEISVSLPVTPAPTQPQKVSPAAENAKVAMRVLVIEDNRDAAHTLKLLLEKLGHQVAVAHDGRSGLEAAQTIHPELVLCDIGLAGDMTGYMVAEHLRRDPSVASAYLVALTGYGREEDQLRASEAGFDLHLTKPMAFETLQALPKHASRT